MTFTIRAHQQRAITAMKAARRDHKSQLIAMATGTGKTHTAHMFMNEEFPAADHRILWIAHSRELVKQARDSALAQRPEMRQRIAMNGGSYPQLGVMQATTNSANARWVYATSQTISNKARLEQYVKHGMPSLIVFDEAHHSTSTTQQDSVMKTLVWYHQLGDFDRAWDKAHDTDDKRTALQLMQEFDTPVHALGLTATPKRMDGLSLKQMFDVISFQYRLPEAIADGYLKPFDTQHVQVQLAGLENVRIDPRTGEFVQSDLEAVFENADWAAHMRSTWQERMPDQPSTMVFMPSVGISRDFVLGMIAAGIPAGHIDFQTCIDSNGNTQQDVGRSYDEHRDYVLREFKDGTSRLLSGFSALLEGFDAPNAAGVLWGRATRSDIVLTQGIGRALRLWPGISRQLFSAADNEWAVQLNNGSWRRYKENNVPFPTRCVVVDFVDVQARILTAASLGGDLHKPAKIEKIEEEEGEEDEYLEDELVNVLSADQQRLGANVALDVTGRVYKFKTLFADSSQDWFAQYGAQSLRLQNGMALFILPPSFSLASEMQRRGRVREQWLEVNGAQASELSINNVETEMQWHFDVADLLQRYSLWLATAPIEKYADKKTGEEREFDNWQSSRAGARLLEVHEDAVAAYESAQPYADLYCADDVLTQKGKNWHYQPLTAAQLKSLTHSGMVINLRNRYNVPVPPNADIAAMNRGDAAALRAHILAFAMVRKSIEQLLQNKGEVADLWTFNALIPAL